MSVEYELQRRRESVKLLYAVLDWCVYRGISNEYIFRELSLHNVIEWGETMSIRLLKLYALATTSFVYLTKV